MTIRAKIILTNIVVFGIILIAVAMVVYDRTSEAETARIDSRLEAYASSFITEFEDEWENNEFPESDEIDNIVGGQSASIRVQLVDDSGRVLFSRGELPPLRRALLIDALHDITSRQNIVISEEKFRLFVRPVEIDEGDRFALVLAAPTAEIRERLEYLSIILLITLSGALLLSGLAVYFLTGRAFRSIAQMVETAEEISASTLHQRLHVSASRDEVQRLAIALNDMMQRIEDAFKSQRRFVADASHELRTPLTVVYSELEFLKRKIQDRDLDDSIGAALQEVDRLSHLVKQLLLLARIDARKVSIGHKSVRLDEILADSVRIQQPNATRHRVQILLQIDDVIEIEGDPEHLKRVFLNVIDNAVKYSPVGGEVTVVLSRDKATAVVTVSDQGPGIDPSETELVFTRFYRSPEARSAQDGSGLGLAIARELVEAHGGTISIGIPESGGTAVTIRLPLPSGRTSSQQE